jgi:protein SCO1/2
MRPVQKVLTTILWGLATLAMVSVIGAGLWRREAGADDDLVTAEQLPVQIDVPPFDLVNQNQQRITLEDLRGKVWIADFIFTNCAGPCQKMTRRMAELQKALPPDVRLVSFSIDPARDKPAALKEYAKIFKADEPRWYFLTGAEQGVMFAQARGMYIGATAAAAATQPGFEISHSTRFVLVGPDAKVRGQYDSASEEAMSRLVKDARQLAEESGS